MEWCSAFASNSLQPPTPNAPLNLLLTNTCVCPYRGYEWLIRCPEWAHVCHVFEGGVEQWQEEQQSRLQLAQHFLVRRFDSDGAVVRDQAEVGAGEGLCVELQEVGEGVGGRGAYGSGWRKRD